MCVCLQCCTYLLLPDPLFFSWPKCCGNFLRGAQPEPGRTLDNEALTHGLTSPPPRREHPTCKSLDNVMLLMSAGLGLKPRSPSKDIWPKKGIPTSTWHYASYQWMCVCWCSDVLAWDAILDLLQRLAKSLSPILSMIHPQDRMVFRDSLIGPQYASLSWKMTNSWPTLSDFKIIPFLPNDENN